MTGKRVLRVPVAGLLMAGLLTMGAWTAPGEATVIKGSLRTSAYAREVPDPGGGLTNQFDLLQNVRLDVLQLGMRSFSLHTSLTARDATGDQGMNARTCLYHGYLKFAPMDDLIGLRWDTRVGRHWVSAGVGTGIVDGVSLRVKRGRCAEISGFYGTLGIERGDGIYLDSTDESARYGGRVRLSPTLGSLEPVVAVSYEQSKRLDLDDSERLGIHASLRIPRGVRLYGDWRRDLLINRTLGFTAGIEHTTATRSYHTWLEYSQRHPSFRISSVYWSFYSAPVTELRGGVRVRAWGTWSIIVDGDLVDFDDGEQEKGVRFLVGKGGISVGWRIHRGYGGDFSGLVLTGHHSFGPRLSLDANLNLSQHQYGEQQKIEQDQSQSVLALRYRLLDDVTLTGQVEGLSNDRFEYDIRFLGMIQWRFRQVLGAREVQP